MSYNYELLVKKALDLLSRFGLDAESEIGGEKTKGKAIRDKIGYSLASRFHNLVEEQDILLICSADLKLEDGCIVEYDGREWFIVKANPVKPADTTIMYEAIARLL